MANVFIIFTVVAFNNPRALKLALDGGSFNCCFPVVCFNHFGILHYLFYPLFSLKATSRAVNRREGYEFYKEMKKNHRIKSLSIQENFWACVSQAASPGVKNPFLKWFMICHSSQKILKYHQELHGNPHIFHYFWSNSLDFTPCLLQTLKPYR